MTRYSYPVILATVLLACATYAGGTIKPASLQEMARYGATHVLEYTHDDLTQTATNTATIVTNTVAAPFSLEFRGFILDTAFDSRVVTNAHSMTVSFGPSTATTKWLNAIQIASDGTPTVKSTFGTDYTAAPTLTSTPTIARMSVVGSNETYSVVSNVTVATTGTVAMTSPLLSAQTSDVKLLLTLSEPGADRSPADFDSGKFRIFLRILGPAWDRM